MSFLHPEYLYYFLPLLGVIFLFLLRKKDSQTQFFSEEVMEKLRLNSNTLTLKKRNILFLLMSVLLIFAMAGPIIKDGKIEVKSKSADIIVALDISDSMLAEDVYPNRLKLAKSKAMELLKLAPTERVGIVAFAKNSYLVSPMSFDHGAVGFLLAQLNTDSITEKGTDFLTLLNVVDKTIKKKSQKHLLILSDGGDKADFTDEISYAKEKDIAVYILGIGTHKGAPIKKEDGSFIKYKGEIIVSKLNENISEFATATGGVYIEGIKSTEDVKTMLAEIASSSEKKEFKSEVIEKFIPLFYYPVGLALFLLLLGTSSMRKAAPSLFILALLSFTSSESKAGLLDFLDLKDAKQAYEKEEYEKAQAMYTKYANDTNNSAAHYNEGNSLYKQNKYDEAMSAYSKVNFDDNISASQVHANIGNTYVKQAKEKALENAVESYEKSLAFHEDKDVRENLEAVKKELEKENEEKKEDKQEKEKKEDQDKKDQEDQKKKDEEKKSQKDDDSKEGEKSPKDKGENKDSDKKSEKEDDKEKKEEQKKENKKDKLDELKKEKQEMDSKPQALSPQKKEQMSDAEEKKWLDKLNMQQNTYMYMLNPNNKKGESTDEKPW